MTNDLAALSEAATPGPWYAERGNDGTFSIYARSREMGTQLLGEFYSEDMGNDLPVMANVALAAASPGLLAALEEIAQLPNYRCVAADMRKIARAAIAAILGEEKP